ncbi:DUF1330 domain-containing protein [Actinacidiphila acididurans]|uniref:DUF1330 domain-containing protein n=1 Tax=Actinacidiphila acididurans TaxID=2784346 RepID=A0ABS2TIC3_9ACTN|nr:DUF1330 domain-containing protein [Actinacidiphila acididurans]MBM9503091.1 DUF1330 domain-containing protein [Actinacidiphila acididurans]
MTAYVISEAYVRDPELTAHYAALASAAIAQYGGTYLVQGDRPTAAEGRWPEDERLIILRFPTMQAARAWYDSPEYAHARAIKPDALERRLLFTEGP